MSALRWIDRYLLRSRRSLYVQIALNVVIAVTFFGEGFATHAAIVAGYLTVVVLVFPRLGVKLYD